ncbi:hypothetical protein Sa4125_11400 [Aureimonas sp. SA4125]|uniref:hybrid sensor histidine kinase/response regulator n=1 Tax=Aureimonas sp. SA4125 TaxID=2826993 RepID=UPI001CC79044|nr:hybrid sensor histidine kinase/response regulator [Aureimonas sp. SA4125]BDA83598.1 hypothetical protein Sa4125_11400 [Aureimonas sp. SA4125]
MQSFLAGSSEMAAQIRERDWIASPLGAAKFWPQSLKTLVSIMLGANQPMFVVWGPHQTLIYNDGYAEILANKHPAALGQPFLDVWAEIADDLAPIVQSAYHGEPVHMDAIRLMMERKGYLEETFFAFSYTPVRGIGGVIEGFFCACNEITGQVHSERRLRKSEAALRAREAQFRTLAQAVPNHVWTATADGLLDWFNDKVYAYCGLTEADLLGCGWTQIVHADDREPAGAAWRQAIEQSAPYETEFRIRRADGTFRWHVVRAEPVPGHDGGMRWIGTNTDINEQRVALSELSAARETLEREVKERTRERNRLWENSQDISVVIDVEGNFRAINPAMTRILGWQPEDMIGRLVFDFIVPDDLEKTAEALAIATEESLDTTIVRYRHKEGGVRWISWVAAPENGVIFATGRNVTAEIEAQAELAIAQEALRQSQKMEAVGQLTGGIAHDFNNMLAVVIGSLDLLMRRTDDSDPRARRHIESAMEGAKRAATLTQRLLAFSRQQSLSPVPVDANGLLSGMADLLRHTLTGKIRLETVVGGGLWRCLVDVNQLENAMLNLAVNARDAMPEGGRLTIETQNAHLDDRYAAGNIGLTPGQYVLIAVSDSGTGMTAEVIEKAFDPFFTTKEIGKGTGLGLSQVYGFVKQSGGHIKIYSEPGRGTTVKIYLPRYFGEETAAGWSDEILATLEDTTQIVLVVEDDDNVRRMTLDAFEEIGYRTLEANGAVEALRLLDLHRNVDLLFTDIVMPEVDGRQLADEALKRFPHLKVVFTTGYTRNAIVHNGVLDAGVDLLPKPFTLDELLSKVRSVLERP